MPEDTGSKHEPRRALVVGGGRGLGAALVRHLTGIDSVSAVIACGRSVEASRALDALDTQRAAKLARIAMDVSDQDSVAGAAERIAAPLDTVIYCAGVLHDEHGLWPEKRVQDIDAERMGRSFAINATGAALCAKAFVGHLPRKGRVAWGNISARVGSIGDNRYGGWYAYRAAKAAQNMITRTFAIELGRYNKDSVCIALHPGTTDTELSQPFQTRVPAGKLFTADYAAGRLLDVLLTCPPEQSGGFFAYDGNRIVW